MQLLPIEEHIEDNNQFADHPLCREGLYMTIDFYKKVGFVKPWIGYFVQQNGVLVGAAGFKGPPKNRTVEIAYGTFEPYRQQGVGTQICRLLVETALQSDPSVNVTARTLPEENFSTAILKKNGFIWAGMVSDPDDGDVWEWVHQKDK